MNMIKMTFARLDLMVDLHATYSTSSLNQNRKGGTFTSFSSSGKPRRLVFIRCSRGINRNFVVTRQKHPTFARHPKSFGSKRCKREEEKSNGSAHVTHTIQELLGGP